MDSERESASYSKIACIGAGASAICLGATLKRWYNFTDVVFFERHADLGGTWFVNDYPGCACDVPSALYSFSFEPNAEWTRVLPPRQELWSYLRQVAQKYDLQERMRFRMAVERCTWINERSRWRLEIRDAKDASLLVHECQFLFCAAGQLVTPRELDVPGMDRFSGLISHSSTWNKNIDLSGKRVVIIGNGCTAAQIVPAIAEKTKHLTQIVRSKHWIMPPIDNPHATLFQLMLKWTPGAMLLQRFLVFCVAENSFRAFRMNKTGRRLREQRRARAETYMQQTAPSEYHELLIPDFEVGCKRRIFDSGYLECLHRDNVTLTGEKALEILPDGIRTEEGTIKADVIILANGFKTDEMLVGLSVRGREGKTIADHWDTLDGPGAYNCTSLSGFPNFFWVLGPNSATGHTSTIMAIENSINFALRVISPILHEPLGAVDLRRDAEEEYLTQLQDEMQNTVWTTGCNAWYLQLSSKHSRVWNAFTYPYSQAYLWYRCLFPIRRHWEYSGYKAKRRLVSLRSVGVLLIAMVGVCLATWIRRGPAYHANKLFGHAFLSLWRLLPPFRPSR